MASASGGIDASRDSVHPPGYAIPEKYKARLEEVQVKDKDTRSDEEIIAMLKTHVPVTSEKNIWGYWHSGIDGMPDWCRRNVSLILPRPLTRLCCELERNNSYKTGVG
jgi:hypothetical protein